MTPSIAAIYSRVSTGEQSTGPQVALLLAEAVRLGFEVPPDRVYVDDGVSGSLDSRPAFNRLLVAIQAREVSAVLVTKLDRLGRSARSLLEFYELADSVEVRVVAAEQGFDTGTPAGRLMRTVLAGMAEFEGDLIRERTQSRMNALKAGMPTKSGRPVGRPRRLTPEKVAEALRLRSLVLPTPWSVVAQRVGLPKETLRRAVREAARAAAAEQTAGKTPPPN